MRFTPRFTLFRLMAMVAATAYCLAISRVLGLVLGTFLVALVICYVLASLLSLRMRAICATCASFIALLPWLGLGQGAFYFPGAADQLPTVTLPSVLKSPLSAFYFVAETPLHLVAENSSEFWSVIFFDSGVGIMRPFFVFVFWLGIALVFGMSAGTSLYADRRGTENGVRTINK
jgi:hypothetical protein